jgi:hypothetical protein
MPGHRTHVRHSDVAIVLLSRCANGTGFENSEPRCPESDQTILQPSIDLAAKARVADTEVLSAVIERKALAPADGRATAWSSSLVQDNHVVALAGEVAGGCKTRNTCPDHCYPQLPLCDRLR